MSASREKKKRQENLANGVVDPRESREAERKASEKKSKILYSTLAILLVVFAVFLVVYNSGVFQRSKEALTANGETYTVADVSYYYQTSYQNFLNSTNGYYATAFGMLDTNKPLDSQNAWGQEGTTWADFFKEQAITNLKFVHAAVEAAEKEGMTLDEDDLQTVKDSTAELKKAAASNNMSLKAYLAAIFGKTMTPDVYEQNMKDGLLAGKYAEEFNDGLSYTDSEVETYYGDHKNDFDIVDGAYVVVPGTPDAKKDEDGNVIEATEEELKAAMEDAKALAEKIHKGFEDGKELKSLAGENGLTITENKEMTYSTGVQMGWLFDEARKSGDSAVLEDEANSNYYVVTFNDRQRDETPDYNVRHILINEKSLALPEGEEATDEQIKAKAQEILDSWDGTEEGFIALAKEFSQDPGSKDNGGLYEDVVKGMMVPEFQNWCYEEGRKEGDTGIVKSSHGEHIMYFKSLGDTPFWKFAATTSMKNEAYSQFETALIESVKVELNESGMADVA